ncbi:manganese efflux pump MntP [Alkaliphilus peptidifermentans]|uniref:Putative Mn2+ efflux pump MntP n=1 Tax=Alkaliphilus peptidifermentans DSM 18978 TaxID=1120976 RepID=A0A1G5IN15_9FIRM|nr:manganese efflux pump [Alkaliphilus peptidifermentans]SCY77413.1 Putative Mn2+ efflux pump MntP [Alkaliphilus peptidifermentans DSM 18978]
MNLGQIILLAVSSNLDDLGVGFSLGLKERVCNSFISVIALISAITMLVGLLVGQQVSRFLTHKTASYISASVFILLGAWFVLQGLKSQSKEYNTEVAIKKSTMKSAIILGIALGIDSITLGVSAGLVYYPILMTTLFAGITSFLFIWAGSKFGNKISIGFIREKADFIAAILLFFLGIFQLW